MTDKKIELLIKNTITVLNAVYGNTAIHNFINKYGIQGLLHRSFLFNDRRVYSFSMPSNLYLSYFHMADVRLSAILNVTQWLLDTVILSRIMNNHYSIRLYTVLFTLKDSRLFNSNGNLRWTDKSNNKDSYNTLTNIYSRINHQINNNKSLSSIHTLVGSNENPYHNKNISPSNTKVTDIYSHPHTHLLLAVTNPSQLYYLKKYIVKDFNKVCGYKPLSFSIQPLMFEDSNDYAYSASISDSNSNKYNDNSFTAVKKLINYLLRDYHLQTKDCPSISDFAKLPHQIQHLIAICQLNSTKGKHLQHYVSNRAISQLEDKIKVLKRYKSATLGHSVSLFNDSTNNAVHSANGRKPKVITQHHTSNNEALSRFYGKGYYSIESTRDGSDNISISLFKTRGPYSNTVKSMLRGPTSLPRLHCISKNYNKNYCLKFKKVNKKELLFNSS